MKKVFVLILVVLAGEVSAYESHSVSTGQREQGRLFERPRTQKEMDEAQRRHEAFEAKWKLASEQRAKKHTNPKHRHDG